MREAEMREAGTVQEIRGGGDRKGEREREKYGSWRGAGGPSKEVKKSHRPKRALRAEIAGL